MADLFGKPDPAPREPVEPFYCYQCAATYSQRCKKCGERYCGNSMKHCPRDPHECKPTQEQQG